MAAGVLAGLDVALAVADDPGRFEVDVEVFGGLEEHAGVRLAAGAVNLQLGDLALVAFVGVMGAVVDAVDEGALLPEEGLHLVVDGLQGLPGQAALCDAGLVGDDDGEVAGVVDAADGLGRTGQELELLGLGQVADVFVDGAVAVEEDGFLLVVEVPRLHDAVLVGPADLGVALGRAHVLDVFGALVDIELAGACQRLQDLAVEVDLPRRHGAVEHALLEDVETGIDAVRVPLGALVLLREPLLDAAMFIGDEQAAVVGMAVRVGEERREAAIFLMGLHEAVEVDVERGVRIQQQEGIGQLVFDPVQGACIAEGLHLVVVLDMRAEGLSRGRGYAAAVAEIVHDDLPEMADRDQDVGEALRHEAADLALEDGDAINPDHRFRDIGGNGRDARPLAACHNDRFHDLTFLRCIVLGRVVDDARAAVLELERDVEQVFHRFVHLRLPLLRHIEQEEAAAARAEQLAAERAGL